MRGRALFFDNEYENPPNELFFGPSLPNTDPLILGRDAFGRVLVAFLRRSVIHYRPRKDDLATGESLYEYGSGQARHPGSLELALNILNAYCPPGYDGYDPVSLRVNVASRIAFELHATFATEILADPAHTDALNLPAKEIYIWMEILRPGTMDRITDAP